MTSLLRKNILTAAFLAVCGFAASANAQVVLNEAYLDAKAVGSISGSNADDSFEYIELAGVAGMSLKGYAVAIMSGGGSGTTETIDEIFYFLDTDTLVGDACGTGYFTLYHSAASTNFGGFVTTSGGTWPSSAYGTFEGRNASAGKLENDGAHTIVLLRKVENNTGSSSSVINPSTSSSWLKNAATEGNTSGTGDVGETYPGTIWDKVISRNLTDYQIVDELSWGNDTGHEYDRYDNKISETPGFNPDAVTRVAYYFNHENFERGYVQGARAPGAATGILERTSIADESWLRGDVLSSGTATTALFFYGATDAGTGASLFGAPTNYKSTRIRYAFASQYTYAQREDTGSQYYLTPGFGNMEFKAGSTTPPFVPHLSQVEFAKGDINFDGVVDCIDRGIVLALTNVLSRPSLDERLNDGSGASNITGDFRYQVGDLNQLLAVANLSETGGHEVITADDLTAFDALDCACGLDCGGTNTCQGGRQAANADLNHDGVVNQLDIVEMMNQITR